MWNYKLGRIARWARAGGGQTIVVWASMGSLEREDSDFLSQNKQLHLPYWITYLVNDHGAFAFQKKIQGVDR